MMTNLLHDTIIRLKSYAKITRNYVVVRRKTIEEAIELLALLKEQEKKQIKLQKKHVITWSQNDGFSMRKLYEAICETLLDEGELFIERTDNHEKVEFIFYVAEERSAKRE